MITFPLPTECIYFWFFRFRFAFPSLITFSCYGSFFYVFVFCWFFLVLLSYAVSWFFTFFNSLWFWVPPVGLVAEFFSDWSWTYWRDSRLFVAWVVFLHSFFPRFYPSCTMIYRWGIPHPPHWFWNWWVVALDSRLCCSWRSDRIDLCL